ncbi:alpha-amylase family glycosyl hydrolase [Luteolibacter luteus]|uniref:Alpha-amylase n=1 Tax=Luteolibacter luteus TaxID=2728835 RepID=A0A858RRN9_9BACT|nr:alpha-amylase family glycosyl hydrolase [Luteolibacter luteus]QJE98800.1 alpha-amylase [Luteolibacter luteus]
MIESPRPVIYQLLPRLFGNTVETRKINGTLAENGCGKFADINDAALASLKLMGFTHLWLTGVLEQASGSAYPDRPADAPDILKGLAGSPYAIKDYFDVCPDYAIDPAKRLDEFKDLLDRCHAHGFKVLIDFVPNHVARSYQSDVRPELSFGTNDDRGCFFHRDNHFFYLRPTDPGGGPPLRLPTSDIPGCTGLFPMETDAGRVSGNNVISWAPSIHDWYETVKLNYGHDFTCGRDTSHLPGPDASPDEVPSTWRTMDQILAYWQAMGVDGFRVDMAHMIPMEFWHWSVKRARARAPHVFFSAEAYDNDPAKLCEAQVLDCLLDAGFDAVYDDPVYDALMDLHDGSNKWANDLDQLTFTGTRFHRSLRYAENHDEVRLASPKEWGGLGMAVGRPVTAVLFGMGRGPLMIYSGQEVGEPAEGREGFGGDDARSTIFDYWSMPELVKWINGHRYDGGRLSSEQRELRDWYARLIAVTAEPAFTRGEFYGLNHANKENPAFGRVGNETYSGHWLYAYLRRDPGSGQAFLVIANFHGSEVLENVRVIIPHHALGWLEIGLEKELRFEDRLAGHASLTAPVASLPDHGLCLPALPPMSAMMMELR